MILFLFGLMGLVCLHFLVYGIATVYICLTEEREEA